MALVDRVCHQSVVEDQDQETKVRSFGNDKQECYEAAPNSRRKRVEAGNSHD
jgi:hypothetical protein